MDLHQKIQQAYREAAHYPELVQRLMMLGITSYTVETASGLVLYRLSGGHHHLHEGSGPVRTVAGTFNKEATVQAIRDNQQGKSDYPGFMDAIAKAGVRLYEATLEGPQKRVTYIGTGGAYTENIPV